MGSDFDYFSRRAREERQAAAGSADRRVGDIHRQLAASYELRVRELSAEARRSTIHLVSAA
jgi:hypothetical protein